MNRTQIPDLGKLAELFRGYPQIKAVYLFGSVAQGKIHPGSDLDLAIIPSDHKGRKIKLDLLTDLERNGFTNIDLVFLDTDDIVLKYEAIHRNFLIYRTSDYDHPGTYSKIIRQYFDFVPYLDVQREAYKRSILDGQSRSHP